MRRRDIRELEKEAQVLQAAAGHVDSQAGVHQIELEIAGLASAGARLMKGGFVRRDRGWFVITRLGRDRLYWLTMRGRACA
jgi:hypothetical protein